MRRSHLPPGSVRPAFPTTMSGMPVIGVLHRLPRADDAVQRATVMCEQPDPSRYAVYTLIWTPEGWAIERRRLGLAYHAALAELIRDPLPVTRSR